MNPIQQAQRLGQSIWLDYMRRGMLKSGELQRLIELGITGVTANPTILEKAISGSTDYDEALTEMAKAGKSAREIYEILATEDIRSAADQLRPVYERTNGADGYASLECSPAVAYDTEGTISEARRLWSALDRPNVLIKVPGTAEGIPAIRQLISDGININITLIFSLDVYAQVREAYIGGLEVLAQSGGEVSRVASVASFFVSRVDTAVDAQLQEFIRQGQEGMKMLLGKAAVANARLAYQAFKQTLASQRFQALRARGARVQRPLWASTGTKNPAYHDLLYVESLIGPDTINTMPLATVNVFLDHGRVASTVEQGLSEANEIMKALAEAGVSMQQVTAKLLIDGVKAFADSFDKLLANIEEKKERLETKHAYPGVSLGVHFSDVESTLSELEQGDVLRRIWQRDHTVWKPDPPEITNRLGWLNVTDVMEEQVPMLSSFSKEVRDDGFQSVVLLGMGGSSLGPETLRKTFGSAAGYPRLVVLDSTVPAQVLAVTESVDLRRTLFLVSSKSGTTIETLSLYHYFRDQVEREIGKEPAGRNFVAITDPDTRLVTLAREAQFRRIFLNPPDIGGRYSVLSYFGLVPAALIGVDIGLFLDRATRMREGCGSCVAFRENHGLWLGAIMGAMSRRGRDKLTLVTSPSIRGFGLWLEQLIAESTGKEGKGIVPIADEPLVEPGYYGEDRLFVYLRLEGDDNLAIDASTDRLKSAGQPVVTLGLNDRYDLGAEFYRWEFATAVAGAVLGINPFDQPNVQIAKDLVHHDMLDRFKTAGYLPRVASRTLGALLRQAKPGDYFAVMAYLQETPEVTQAISKLRAQVMQHYRIATTAGYGPRFLHSTGQLHKGGPNTGLFLQLTGDHIRDIPVPGWDYTLGILTDAEALGDFQALQSGGRRIIRVNIGPGHEAATIRGLAS